MTVSKALRAIFGGAAAIALSLFVFAQAAQAQTRTLTGEIYRPGIWIDPDGCEHWVMDDGTEGFMTPNVTPDGIPVCRRANPCMVANSDQLFDTAKWHINATNRQRLISFFQASGATAYVIDGHTDPRGGLEYNMNLSRQRAKAVADVARQAGVRISKVRGFGPTEPIASNATASGMAKNRRVEIFCIR